VADDLKASIPPRNMQPEEEMIYDICMTMIKNHEISDELFNRANAILGDQQLIDLIAVSGTYVTVAMLPSLGEESSPADNTSFPRKGQIERRLDCGNSIHCLILTAVLLSTKPLFVAPTKLYLGKSYLGIARCADQLLGRFACISLGCLLCTG
jgi:hypothetical protein